MGSKLGYACLCVCAVCAPDLGLVPFLSLGDVLGGDALVLHADVPEGSGQVGFGHVHLDLHLSVLHLALQLVDLLPDTTDSQCTLHFYSRMRWSHVTLVRRSFPVFVCHNCKASDWWWNPVKLYDRLKSL